MSYSRSYENGAVAIPPAPNSLSIRFKMICTGCCAGAIISWEIYTGKKVLEFANAHAHAAVSCLEIGHGGRRLISGASNGDIFVWNVLSGIVLQKLYKNEPKEVTGVCSLPQFIYSIGWDGRLVYGNFDMILDHFPRSFKRYNPHMRRVL